MSATWLDRALANFHDPRVRDADMGRLIVALDSSVIRAALIERILDALPVAEIAAAIQRSATTVIAMNLEHASERTIASLADEISRNAAQCVIAALSGDK